MKFSFEPIVPLSKVQLATHQSNITGSYSVLHALSILWFGIKKKALAAMGMILR